MPDLDRSRLARLLAAEQEAYTEHHPRSRELFEQGDQPLRPGPDDVDEQVERRLPALPRPRPGQPDHRRRRPHLRRLRARRHRGDGRSLPAGDGRGGRAPDGRLGRPHDDAAHRRRPVGRRGADPTLRAAAVELHPVGHRREPLGGAPGPAGHRAPQDPRLLVLLPRVGRRGLRDPRPRGQGAVAPRQRRSPGRPRPHDARRDVERPRVARARARPRRRRGGPHRAGADEHRHRAARARVHGGPARAGHALRHPAHDRRDAHLLGRVGRRDHRVGARARHLRHRQVDRWRHPVGGLRHLRGGRGSRHRPHRGRGRRHHRRRRCRWHPRGQRAVDDGDAGHPAATC